MKNASSMYNLSKLRDIYYSSFYSIYAEFRNFSVYLKLLGYCSYGIDNVLSHSNIYLL